MFDRAVVINLERRPDRLEAFERQLDGVTLPFVKPTRFNAIDGQRVPTPPSYDGSSKWAITRSHMAIVEDVLNSGLSSVLIFEDDARLCDNFSEQFTEFMRNVPNDWQCLLFGYHLMGDSYHFPTINGARRVTGGVLNHAYALRGNLLKSYYTSLAMMGGIGQHKGYNDQMLGKLQVSFPSYAADPPLVTQSGSASDNYLPPNV